MTHFLQFLTSTLGERGSVVVFYSGVLLALQLPGLGLGWLIWGRGRKRDLRRAEEGK